MLCQCGVDSSHLFWSSHKANKILTKKIEEDPFLDLVTVKTDICSACKEPYR
uniref:Putative GTP diphosphokinase RSH1ic n=1 Tax=Rhizophora mucronata TaxID=61149 RepID=A0A2P2MT59_RHIMU